MGVVTGKGLSDLIREEFGLRITFVLMVLLVVVNYTNVVTEFIGIAGSLHLFHVSKLISVPVCAVLVWALVHARRLQKHGKNLPRASLVYITLYLCRRIVAAHWHDALRATVKLPANSVWTTRLHVHGHRRRRHHHRTLDAVLPAVVDRGEGNSRQGLRRFAPRRDRGQHLHRLIAWFIVVACAATLFVHGMGAIQVAADAAEAMRPLAGDYAFILFAFGLFNASLFAASILPLSTAYTVCEGLGVESGVDKKLPRGAVLLLALFAAHRWRRSPFCCFPIRN
jgi:Mn2+/Fe2+ NRAMP family transporter